MPPQEIVLRERLDEYLEQDVSEMFNLFIGSALHEFIEKYEDSKFSEKYLSCIVNDQKITGRIDNYDEKSQTVIDYKTAKVSTVQNGRFDSWDLQGKLYAWLLMKNGIIVDNIKFYAILKDWDTITKSFKGNSYPQEPIFIYEKKIRSDDLQEIQKFVEHKVDSVLKMKKMSTDEILETELPEKFQKITKYAIKEHGKSRAKQVTEDKEYAEWYCNRNDNYYVEKRHEENFNYNMTCKAIQLAKKIRR